MNLMASSLPTPSSPELRTALELTTGHVEVGIFPHAFRIKDTNDSCVRTLVDACSATSSFESTLSGGDGDATQFCKSASFRL